jgi:hypothetical protein
MVNDFLTASTEAAKGLQAARVRHQQLKNVADQRLKVALARHRSGLEDAAAVEADAWRALMDVPGMTVATAGRIGAVGATTVRRWLATPRRASGSCS